MGKDNYKTPLTKKAIDSYEWAIKDIELSIKKGKTPEKAMKQVGIESVPDILFFIIYLREYGHETLLNKIRN